MLERGRASANVIHRDHTKWRVDVGPFGVDVVGTAFTVSWDPVGEVLRLRLQEGQVVVSGAFLRQATRVSQGQTFRVFCKEGRSELVEQVVSGNEPDPTLIPETVVETPAHLEVAEAGELSRGPQGADPSALRRAKWLELATAGKYREALELVERGGFESECSRASGRDLVTLGDVARFSGNASLRAPGLPSGARQTARRGARELQLGALGLQPATRLRRSGQMVRCVSARPAAGWPAARSHGSAARVVAASGRPREGREDRAAIPVRVPDRCACSLGSSAHVAVMSWTDRGFRGLGQTARVALVALLLAAHAHGQEPRVNRSRLVLLGKDSDERLLTRVNAELTSLGFRVETVRDDDSISTSLQMEGLAQNADAIASIRIVAADAAVDVWIVNRATHEMVLRRVPTGKDPAIAALRTVEVLRTSLIDLRALVPSSPEPPATSPPSPSSSASAAPAAAAPARAAPASAAPGLAAPAPAPAAPASASATPLELPPYGNVYDPPTQRYAATKSHLGLGAEFAQAVAAGGGFSSQVLLMGRWMVGPHWGVQAIGVIPLQSQKLEAPEGNAHLAFGLLGAGLHWQPSSDAATPNFGARHRRALARDRGGRGARFSWSIEHHAHGEPLCSSRLWAFFFEIVDAPCRSSGGSRHAPPRDRLRRRGWGRRTVATWGRPWGALGIGVEFIMY